MADRAVKCTRKTSETDIVLELNLDGKGNAKIDTGIGFFEKESILSNTSESVSTSSNSHA